MTIWHVRYPYLPRDNAPKVVAVAWDGGRLTVKTLAGRALPASLLLATLKATVGTDPRWWSERCVAHATRRYPKYTIETYVADSGVRNYTLRYLRDEALADWPTGGRLHVSMYSKLNEGVQLRGEDIAPLLRVFLDQHGQEDVGLDVREPPARTARRNAEDDAFVSPFGPATGRLEGWHALNLNKTLRFSDGRVVVTGETLTIPGPIGVGVRGLHAARTIARAVEDFRLNVGYRPAYICRVALGADALPWDDHDRSVSTERTCLEMREYDYATLLAIGTDEELFRSLALA